MGSKEPALGIRLYYAVKLIILFNGYLMTIAAREQQAFEVYMKLLKSKGFGPETFLFRTAFLNRLMPLLADKDSSSRCFRAVLDDLVDTIAEDEWPESLAVAREYYPFWVNDMKAVTLFNQTTEEDILPIDWKPIKVDLATLWHTIDEEKFSRTDSWALKAYSKALEQHIDDKTLVEARLKLAKLLLIRLSTAPEKSSKTYRVAADATQPLFHIKENRSLFLTVIRELFHFWAGNPEADAYIVGGDRISRS